MKQLQQQFQGRGEVKGYTFTQIRVTDLGFIYSKELNGSLSYEVFKRKENKRFDCISYPTSNSFGVFILSPIMVKHCSVKLRISSSLI